jgi:hypothetical protein
MSWTPVLVNPLRIWIIKEEQKLDLLWFKAIFENVSYF